MGGGGAEGVRSCGHDPGRCSSHLAQTLAQPFPPNCDLHHMPELPAGTGTDVTPGPRAPPSGGAQEKGESPCRPVSRPPAHERRRRPTGFEPRAPAPGQIRRQRDDDRSRRCALGCGPLTTPVRVPHPQLLPAGRPALPAAERLVAHPGPGRSRLTERARGRGAPAGRRGAGEPVQRRTPVPGTTGGRAAGHRAAPRAAGVRGYGRSHGRGHGRIAEAAGPVRRSGRTRAHGAPRPGARNG
jgi:hypothetical protein